MNLEGPSQPITKTTLGGWGGRQDVKIALRAGCTMMPASPLHILPSPFRVRPGREKMEQLNPDDRITRANSRFQGECQMQPPLPSPRPGQPSSHTGVQAHGKSRGGLCSNHCPGLSLQHGMHLCKHLTSAFVPLKWDDADPPPHTVMLLNRHFLSSALPTGSSRKLLVGITRCRAGCCPLTTYPGCSGVTQAESVRGSSPV